MSKEVGQYAVVVDPSVGVSVQPLQGGSVGIQELYSIIDCDCVELSVLTDSLELYVDEEGFVNGRADSVGVFQVQDADGERLGQHVYAGRGVILQRDIVDGEIDSVGFTEDRATKIAKSLIFQTSFL